jgi:signal transduction histidine kinase/CheY-like chemotaxis protein/HPt (histidine-containing phosphotransfer) domain-containing protein
MQQPHHDDSRPDAQTMNDTRGRVVTTGIVVAICVLPLLLNWMGIDFAAPRTTVERGLIDTVNDAELVNLMLGPLSGPFIHTLLEWSAFAIAVFTALLALAHIRIARDMTTPIIGLALLTAGCMDAFHTLAANRLILPDADAVNLLPFTWALARFFTASIIAIGCGVSLRRTREIGNGRMQYIVAVAAGFAVMACLTIYIAGSAERLPQTMYPDAWIRRPWDVGPLILFAVPCAILCMITHRRHQTVFSYALLVSLVPQVATQAYMAFGSAVLFDSWFNITHTLKIVAYGIPLLGLCADHITARRRNEKAIGELSATRAALLARSEELERTNERLVSQKAELTGLVAEIETRNNDLEEAKKTLEQAQQAAVTMMEDMEIATREAAAGSAAKSQFLANMSHEIRTPMNGILGMTGLLIDTRLSDEQRDYAETVRSSCDALLTVINDILDFSKIEAGKLTTELLEFDPHVVLEEVLELLAEKAHASEVELTPLVDAAVPRIVNGDPGRLRQVLTNLVGNAIKFTSEGEITVRVMRQDGDDPELVRFEVQDDGIGISPEGQQALFRPFSQIDGSMTRKFGGSGLGLAISKQLVELMGGEIGLESEPGRGSLFWFTVKFGLCSQTASNTGGAVSTGNGATALVVDGHEASRRRLEQLLTRRNFKPELVPDAETAVSRLRAAARVGRPYGLVVIGEPQGATGSEPRVWDLVSTMGEERDTLPPFVLATVATRRVDTNTSRAAGWSGVLVKPVRQIHLDAILGRLFDVQEQAEPDLGPAKPAADAESEDQSLRVLLAEDNLVNQKVATLMLERLGHSVDVATNGREAVRAVTRATYDVILMDCQMPEMDGYEATYEIRRLEGDSRHTPVVALTANAMKGDRERCLEAGMDDYVTKPIKPDELRRVIGVAAAPGSSGGAPTGAETGDEATAESVDGDAIVARLGGDAEMARELAAVFLDDYPARLDEVRAAVASEDADLLRRAAHTIKGAVGNFSEDGAYAAAWRLEEMGRNADLGDTKTALATLEGELSLLRPVLEKLAAVDAAA